MTVARVLRSLDFSTRVNVKRFTGPPHPDRDIQFQLGHVTVGISRDTSQFAVDAIRCWWRTKGLNRYSDAGEILVHADAGGSNGYRRRLWELALQQWANSDGLIITVCHYPTGASKWNPIEHRLFSQISNNWAGTPLHSKAVKVCF